MRPVERSAPRPRAPVTRTGHDQEIPSQIGRFVHRGPWYSKEVGARTMWRMDSHATLAPPAAGDTWVGLSAAPLPTAEASAWAVRPDCGGVVTFTGTARDHAEGRPGVHSLTYEAYEAQALPRLDTVAEEARKRWPVIGRICLLHRTGTLSIGESAVVVAVSAPHRDEAFAGARFCIDTLKRTVPIWKREAWDGGESWGLDAQHIVDATNGTSEP